MVNIKLDNNHRITSDSRQYILEERVTVSKGKNIGNEYYKPLGYYSDLCRVLKDYRDIGLRNSNCESIPELLELIKSSDKKIDKILKGN